MLNGSNSNRPKMQQEQKCAELKQNKQVEAAAARRGEARLR